MFETNGLKTLCFQEFETQARSTRGQADVNLRRLTGVAERLGKPGAASWRRRRAVRGVVGVVGVVEVYELHRLLLAALL